MTLVTERAYFGLDALRLRAAANRVLLRVVGLPPDRALVSASGMARDFGMSTVSGRRLADDLVDGGLLRTTEAHPGDYKVTSRFLQIAAARVVEPLQRERAQALLTRACELARRVNVERHRNPYAIDLIAVFGDFMSRDPRLGDLSLGVVLRRRPKEQLARWGRIEERARGRKEIRATLEKPSTFLQVRFVKSLIDLPRPFSVVFRADR